MIKSKGQWVTLMNRIDRRTLLEVTKEAPSFKEWLNSGGGYTTRRWEAAANYMDCNYDILVTHTPWGRKESKAKNRKTMK